MDCILLFKHKIFDLNADLAILNVKAIGRAKTI